MEFFINELSLEGQYATDAEFVEAVKMFKSVFDFVNGKVKQKNIYSTKLLANYNAIKNSSFSHSLNQIRDKSLKTALINVVYNKLNAKDWLQEQTHSTENSYIYLTELDIKDVSGTSIAEVAERNFQSSELHRLLIGFSNSSFVCPHPTVASCRLISIVRNDNEEDLLDLDYLDCHDGIYAWLESKLNLSAFEYNESLIFPPTDTQTILRDVTRFQKTSLPTVQGRAVYKESATGRYWYVDNLHFGKAAHLEVFDKFGKHIGEAKLEGVIDESKKDTNKSINAS